MPLAVGAVYYVISKFTGLYIPCLFHEITGLYCPGCGVSRLCIHLIDFEFQQAFRSNQYVMSGFPVFVIAELISDSHPRIANVLRWFLLVGCVVFGILRNVIPELAPV